jgi:hypothetical protein
MTRRRSIMQTTKGCDTYHRHLVSVEDQWGRILHCPRGPGPCRIGTSSYSVQI